MVVRRRQQADVLDDGGPSPEEEFKNLQLRAQFRTSKSCIRSLRSLPCLLRPTSSPGNECCSFDPASWKRWHPEVKIRQILYANADDLPAARCVGKAVVLMEELKLAKAKNDKYNFFSAQIGRYFMSTKRTSDVGGTYSVTASNLTVVPNDN